MYIYWLLDANQFLRAVHAGEKVVHPADVLAQDGGAVASDLARDGGFSRTHYIILMLDELADGIQHWRAEDINIVHTGLFRALEDVE